MKVIKIWKFYFQDTFVLAKIKQEGHGDFGKQRIMIMLGQAFAPLIAGVLVDELNEGKGIIEKI